MPVNETAVVKRKLGFAVAVLAVCLAVAIALQIGALGVPPGSETWRGLQTATGAETTTGVANVGGPFQLTDQTGRTVTERDLIGRPFVVYFGWRLDPDLTPAALQVLAAALAQLQPKSELPRAVFVSLDGARDQVADLAVFINGFKGDWLALRGDEAATVAMARAYKLYFKRLPDAALPGGYSIDQASLYYVMGRDGAFLGAVPHTTDVVELKTALAALLK
jgi:cytochrome oxidase Cu insertion factor (SCO1/SenC/PrrC family)